MESPISKSASAPTTPTEQTRQLHNNASLKKKKRHRVHFPEDEILVTCYLDPPDPWSKGYQLTVDTVLTAYVACCDKQGIQPLPCVVDQLQEFLNKAEKCRDGQRVFDFSLLGEKLSVKQCEALEEVFRRIKFNSVDFEGCCLEDEGAAALFDMIEYYDSAAQLNISYIKYIDCRGWQACSRMLKKTNALVYLNARSTGLNEQILLILGKALRMGSNLTTLHLENCGIYGRCLVILVAALKSNTTLRELFLAENKISSSDGFQLGNLLRTNTHLELLDLSNNKLQNEGLVHLMESLGQQSNTSGRGLSTLILWNNQLSRDGMSCVAKALNSARTIKRFNLGSNAITCAGIEELKHSFICNQTLEVLELENCKIGTEGAVFLAEYISSNSIIQKMDLRSNDISLSGVKAIMQALENNHSIISVLLDPTSMDLNEPINERVNAIQLITQYCSRNKEEKRLKPVQDVYLSTLFNGIFSRVIPSSALIQSNEKEDLSLSQLNGNIQRGRFQVLPVRLEEDNTQNVCSTTDSSSLNSDAVDARARFFSEMNFPTKSVTQVDGSSTVDSNQKCNGCIESSPKEPEKQETDDVFIDEFEMWSKNDLNVRRRHSDILAYHSRTASEEATPDEKGDSGVTKSQSPNALGGKKKGKPSHLTLTLSKDNSTDLPHVEVKERRLSSPILHTEPPIFRRAHSIKCCKALEGLDLCSSMPLSPTKLYENFSFPQPAVEEVPLRRQQSAESPHSAYLVH